MSIFNKNGTLQPLPKSRVNAEMEEYCGNWLRWENFWRTDTSKFSDPERGAIIYINTEFFPTNATILRRLIEDVSGKNSVRWNGLPRKPFTYDGLSSHYYVSLMLFVRDEQGKPTKEFLTFLYTQIMRDNYPILDSDLHEAYREPAILADIASDMYSLAKDEKQVWKASPEKITYYLFDQWDIARSDTDVYPDMSPEIPPGPPQELIMRWLQKWPKERQAGRRTELVKEWQTYRDKLQAKLVSLPKLDTLNTSLRSLPNAVLQTLSQYN